MGHHFFKNPLTDLIRKPVVTDYEAHNLEISVWKTKVGSTCYELKETEKKVQIIEF